MTVWETFLRHAGRQIDKWKHYFPIYEKHFAPYVGKSPHVLEIGVDHGGSLQLWKAYFGRGAVITGVDIDPQCAAYESPDEGIYVMIRDQKLLHSQAGPFDIIIDDGSHDLFDQETTFTNLWPACKGVYLIEDCHGTYPKLRPQPALVNYYPWVVVAEREQRIITGHPSRELRPDEIDARRNYGL